jgi:hypothetical protein
LTHLLADELDDEKLQDEMRPPWDGTTSEPLSTMIASICEHDAEHFELIEQYFEIGR